MTDITLTPISLSDVRKGDTFYVLASDERGAFDYDAYTATADAYEYAGMWRVDAIEHDSGVEMTVFPSQDMGFNHSSEFFK